MSVRRSTTRVATVLAIAALATASLTTTAQADPVPASPGTSLSGTPSQLWSSVGADAFAELGNEFAKQYNAQSPAPTEKLQSFDAINPVTGAAGENIVTKPGCSIPRSNGANAGITALLAGVKSAAAPAGDGTSYCVDYVRASRAKAPTGETALTFYAQSRDAVSWAIIGSSYAPVSLTSAQLKSIFECAVTDWSEVGGQKGEIHVYSPPTSAATLTFFLSAIGSSVGAIQTGCGSALRAQQQNDGTTLKADPQGIAPYAVTKWAAQVNAAPGIADLRGGTRVGDIAGVPGVVTTSFEGNSYQVLNPAFPANHRRLFFNAVRNDAPAGLQAIFQPGGFLCTHADELLIPFGNTPLGDDNTQQDYCGKAS